MAREVGDLWPQSSGSASLGAEMRNGGFTGEVRPFAHVHMNSGIFHSSVHASGIVRYQRNTINPENPTPGFGFSFDGGKNFIYEISLGGSPLACEIGTAYGPLDVLSSGALTLSSLHSDVNIRSGFNGGLGHINIEPAENLTVTLINGNESHNIDGGLSFIVGGNEVHAVAGLFSETITGSRNSSSQSETHSVVNGFDVLSTLGGISFETQDINAPITLNSVGNTVLEAFNHSGVLNYRFGPYESWYIKTNAITGGPYNDGGWPIAHSGNVSQLINQAVLGIGSGLQNAYNGGRRITMNSTIGDMEIVSDTAKLKLANTTRAALNMSGVYTRPSSSQEMGDMWMMAHSALENIGAATQATSLAEARARSLGLATIAYDTGSGIINLMNGSGIMQCLNSSLMKLTTVTQTLPLVSATPCSDNNYHIGTGLSSGIITILTPGLYKADFKVFAFKDTGTTPQTVQTNATLNGGNILGSFCNSFHYDATTAANASAGMGVLFNANAGDQFRLVSSSTLAGADNCTLGVRGALLILQKIGPRRGTF